MTTPTTNPLRSRNVGRKLMDYALYAALAAFSFWLMFKTFSYDYEKHLILLSPKIWSDFGATLPLIRSFSFGENWPPEYPIFPGLPIQYHFLFYFVVGKLEQVGVPLHWALNVPSAIGFFGILAMTYAIARNLFNDRRVASLSVIFFLFNGSWAFVQFFQKHPIATTPIANLFSNTEFSAMGPWDGGNVLGVWHLNVFINQRHFTFALGLLMLFIFICFWLKGRSRKVQVGLGLVFGLVIGLLPLLHKPVMLMFAVTMATFFFTLPYLRAFLVVCGSVGAAIVLGLWLMSFSVTGPAQESIAWHPGFTMHGDLAIWDILLFFWNQFGIHTILIPVGMYLAPKRVQQAMIPAVLVFAVAFFFKFSPDVMANHKFINFSLLWMQMLSAYAIVFGYDVLQSKSANKGALGKGLTYFVFGVTALLVVFLLTLSGIIDFLAIANDRYVEIRDIEADQKTSWFFNNTPPDAVILNSSFLYHPASIAGRKVFIGWPYFTTTAGYDHAGRFEVVKEIYSGNDTRRICSLMAKNNIEFLTVQDTSRDRDMAQVNVSYFMDNFSPRYLSEDKAYAVFAAADICLEAGEDPSNGATN